MGRNCTPALFLLSYLNLSTYSQLLAQYVCCQAVADTLPPCFLEKCNVEKSSITVPNSDVFCEITYQIHFKNTKLVTSFHIFKVFVEIWLLIQ